MTASVADRLIGHLDFSGGPTSCWLWQGHIRANGYARMSVNGKERYVHRLAYELAHGSIPDGLDVDHVCHNLDEACPGGPCIHRRCCNPSHLRIATRSENLRAGRATRGRKVEPKTHCKWGHLFDEQNTWIRPDGGRMCKACNNRRQQETRQRVKARR